MKNIKIALLVQELRRFLLNGWIFPIGQSGEACRWRVCYQQGLPRLVNRPGVAGAVLQTALSLIN